MCMCTHVTYVQIVSIYMYVYTDTYMHACKNTHILILVLLDHLAAYLHNPQYTQII